MGRGSCSSTRDLASARVLSQSLKTIIKYAKACIEKKEILNRALTITRSVPKMVVGQPDRLRPPSHK